MSSNRLTSDRLANLPSDYKATIDRTLESKSELIISLEKVLRIPEAAAYAKEIRSFIDALHRGISADDFLEDGLLAIWLPALLTFGRIKDRGGSDMREVVEAIVRSAEDRSSRSGALTYVVTVFFLALGVVLFLCSTVIPVFREMFNEFELKLPPPTLALVWVSDRLGPRSIAIFGVSLTTVLMLWLAMRIGRRLFVTLDPASVLRGFSSGSNSSLIAMSRFVTTLAELLRIGTPIGDALNTSGKASQSVLLAGVAMRFAKDLRTKGKPSHVVTPYFPRLLFYGLDPTGCGEPNIPLLDELGRIYSERARYRTDWVTGFIVPVATIFIGCFVGFVAFALFLPLISLITSLS
jgi:type IV pilus assembly protein PilC